MDNQKCVYQFNGLSSVSIHMPICQNQEIESQPIPVCYSFWKLDDQALDSTSRFVFLAKGCWSKEPDLCKTKLFNNILFCCCTGEFCNRDLSADQCYADVNRIKNLKFTINLVSFIIILIIVPIIIYLLVKLIKRKKIHFRFRRSQTNNRELDALLISHDHIELIEYRSRGRYGDIYRARLVGQKTKTNEIAVKIFKREDYESFKNELKIYKLPDMNHLNVLRFIADLETDDNMMNQLEYWLITEYQSNGSLNEYLLDNLLNEQQITQICLDIANGLAFLHGSNNSTSNRQIAHRDFKSGNILLNDQLRACIADFGLALVFYNHKLETDTLNQVGTSRYFSPELLDGAINFAGDSLLKVDIYACALVFWEILSRNCKLQGLNKVKEYKLPFELELGSMPTITELRNHVSFKQRRPIIEEHWRFDEFLSSFCRIIEDSWQHDAETRLSASCIAERLMFLKSYLNC